MSRWRFGISSEAPAHAAAVRPWGFPFGLGSEWLLPAAMAWATCAAIVAVCLVILGLSFVEDFPADSKVGLGNYSAALDSYLFTEVIPNTVLVGVGTIAVVLFFSVPIAWLLNRTNLPLRSTWNSLIAVSVVVPAYLKAMGWIMLINPKIGLVNKSVGNLLGVPEVSLDVASLWGISFIQGLMLTPVMVFLLAGPMRSLDPALEEAAAVTGAGSWTRFWRINFPLLWPAIFGGTIYTSMTAISIFDAAAMLGGFDKNPILATVMYLKLAALGGGEIPNYGVAGVYGLVILLPSLTTLYFYFGAIAQQHRYVVIAGRGYRALTVDLGKYKVLALSFIGLYIALAVLFPFLMLFWQSLLPYLQFPSFEALAVASFAHYAKVMDVVGKKSIVNTAVLIVLAPSITLFFGLMLSWIVTKTRLRGRRALDSIAMLPHAIPGLGFAFAMLVLGIMARKYLSGISFYGTVSILVVTHVLNRISYVTRITNAALLQVSSELEDAALVCGASRLITIFRILIPLVTPALLFAGLWTAILTFRDLTIAVMLAGPRNRVISLHVWQAWRAGETSEAAATGVIMILVMGLLAFVAQKLLQAEVAQ